ncbi:MAG: VTT domain-containing protein [Gammaproteobacteria bacterium]|nr:VTT domain-containing protein [Gammaproteobacteria bacterium]
MNKVLRIGILLLLVVGIAAAIIYRDLFDAAALETWVKDAGSAGPLVFMLIYAIGTVFFLPGSVLTLAGGALFGPVFGTFYNLTAATIGAMISFIAARYLAHDWVEKKTGGRMKQLKQGVEGEGWKFVAFVRLVPLFPFNLLNYALGLTKIKFSHYSIATYVFMLPGAIAYTYLGYAGREAIAGGDGLIQKIMLAFALLAIVGFLPSLIGRLRRGPMMDVENVKQKLDTGEDVLLLDVRSAEDYVGEQGHVKDSVLIPVEELEKRLAEIENFQEKTIMTICRTDRRSAKAAQILAKHGFVDVHVVKQGMTDWNAKGYPTVN